MPSPATVMDAGSELGFHRGGFSGMGFSSLMVVDIAGTESGSPSDPRTLRDS